MSWGRINRAVANLFTSQPIRGSEDMSEITRQANFNPRPWHDQRGIVDATDPQQPEAIDLSDLERVNRG